MKALNFMPTLPQLNYKISALEQMLSSESLKEEDSDFAGTDHTVEFDHVSFGYGDKEVITILV